MAIAAPGRRADGDEDRLGIDDAGFQALPGKSSRPAATFSATSRSSPGS